MRNTDQFDKSIQFIITEENYKTVNIHIWCSKLETLNVWVQFWFKLFGYENYF